MSKMVNISVKGNAVEVIRVLVKSRNWHEGKIERRLASYYKKSAMDNNLTYEVAINILKELGYELQVTEVWIKK